MTYSEVFGGGSINPAQRTYLSLVSAVDVTLEWPLNTVATDNVAADIIDADMTAPGLTINFSDARQISNGFTSLISNVGSQDFTVRDALGGSIVSPVPGTAWFIYLQDNSTEDGTWAIFQLGATVSVADAAALAGAGIKAISATLNQRIAPTLTSITPITWTDADRAQFTIWGGGVGVLDLPSPGTVGADWFSMVRNEGTGILTVTPPSGQIDSTATLVMNPGDSAFIVTNGTDFFTIGLGGSTTVGFDYVQIDISGSGDFILSGVQLNRISYEFVGLLTGNRKVVVPNTIQQYWAANFTTGAFAFEIATAAQVTPIQITQNNRSILYCDGTNVVDAETGTLTPPISIGQGGTGATDAATALSNLGGISNTRQVNTQALSGLAGGGDLSADRNLVLDVDNLTLGVTVDSFADTIPIYDDDGAVTVKVPIASLSPQTLSDLAGNLAVVAIGSSNVDIRGTANADASPRRLQFTWQDGTRVGYIGWNSFSEEMFITNEINHPDGSISIFTNHASAEVLIGGNLRVLGNTSIKGSAANNALLRFTDTSFNGRASIGFIGSDVWTFENLPQQDILFQGEDSITATVDIMRLNPNTGVRLYYDQSGLVARCAASASGGFEVNNLATGLGFGRVLTIGDIATGSFTGTITGVTVLTQGTIEWLRISADDGNDLVTMSCDVDIIGTSNTTQMTMTGIPVALRPTTSRRVTCWVRNESKFTCALAEINSSGVITFYAPDNASNTTNPFWSFTTFGNTGTKGLENGWTITYRLD